jgi:2-desacetyl-2-hydroxyethyl bacteriochlorophyllide A dehydrogenase
MENLAPRMGDHQLVIGAGPIGVQLMRVARLQGAAHITVVERNPARLMFAAEAGADQALSSLDDLPLDFFDAVIDATGVPAVLTRTLDFVRPGGRVLWFGVPRSDATMTLEPFKIFRKGLTVMGSFTSKRNSYQAVRLLQSGALRVDDLISHRLPLDDFLHGCELMEQGAEGVRKVMILPQA